MLQTAKEKKLCPISHQYCDDDCDYCVSDFLGVCDECHEPGHIDTDGWVGDFNGHNPPLIYCNNCASKLGLKEDK